MAVQTAPSAGCGSESATDAVAARDQQGAVAVLDAVVAGGGAVGADGPEADHADGVGDFDEQRRLPGRGAAQERDALGEPGARLALDGAEQARQEAGRVALDVVSHREVRPGDAARAVARAEAGGVALGPPRPAVEHAVAVGGESHGGVVAGRGERVVPRRAGLVRLEGGARLAERVGFLRRLDLHGERARRAPAARRRRAGRPARAARTRRARARPAGRRRDCALHPRLALYGSHPPNRLAFRPPLHQHSHSRERGSPCGGRASRGSPRATPSTSSQRSVHRGFSVRTKSSSHSRRHFFNCRSRTMASRTSSCRSNHDEPRHAVLRGEARASRRSGARRRAAPGRSVAPR